MSRSWTAVSTAPTAVARLRGRRWLAMVISWPAAAADAVMSWVARSRKIAAVAVVVCGPETPLDRLVHLGEVREVTELIECPQLFGSPGPRSPAAPGGGSARGFAAGSGQQSDVEAGGAEPCGAVLAGDDRPVAAARDERGMGCGEFAVKVVLRQLAQFTGIGGYQGHFQHRAARAKPVQLGELSRGCKLAGSANPDGRGNRDGVPVARHHRKPCPHVLSTACCGIDERWNIQYSPANRSGHAGAAGRRAPRSDSISVRKASSPGSGGTPAALRAHAMAFGEKGPQWRSISSARASRATRCAAASLM